MGKRSATKSVAAVMAAFIVKRRNWTQADLSRAVGVGREAIRKILIELQESDFPLERHEEPPQVYWSVPKDWYPGGVLFKQEDVPELLRQLTHLPRSKARDRLLAIVMGQLSTRARQVPAPPVVSGATSDDEQRHVPVIEDAAAQKRALNMRYFTASRGTTQPRHVSVHLIEIGPPARFIATCHQNGDLRWFRVDRVIRASLDENEPFRDHPSDAVAAFRAASLDGFKGAGPPVACSFFVRVPESKWIVNNLLEGMRHEDLRDGVRVHVETSAVLRLARFVVGLGEAAYPENVELAQAVAELARGALGQVEDAAVPRQLEFPGIARAPVHAPVRLRSGV